MDSLSYATVLWSMTAACALLLAIVHAVRWLLDRTARADLTFALVALCFVGVAFAELRIMHARDAAELGEWIRWAHLPLFGLLASTVVFVRLHLGTGRPWLMWSYIAARAVLLLANFTSSPNLNFARIDSIERIRFFGDMVSVVGEAVTGRWQWVATLTVLMLVAYVLDAAIASWRRGTADARRRAVLVGGSLLLFVLIASAYTQLVIWKVVRLPFLITPSFLVPLLVMAFELGRDAMRASRLARELRESQRRLELAAGSAKLGLWEWDGRRRRVFATRQAREIFGLGEGEAGDFRRWLEKVHPEDAQRLTREMSRAMDSGEEYESEFRIRPDGQTTRWVTARGRAEQAAPDRPALVRGVLRDVSEQRLAEVETHELRRELAHAGRVSMLGQLSSSLAHEISQPLGAIQRNAEAADMLLESESPDHDELKAIVTDILRDDRRAREVIDRLRSMLKRRDAELQAVATDGLMQDVMELARADAASRNVTLEHVPSPGLPKVTGDRVQLSQVLLNLILNAMDAIAGQPAGRRSIVLWSKASADGQVELCVTDSGLGVPPDLARKIFEPFYSTKSEGLGMGLAISRAIAEAHGGSLTVETNEHGGATFRMKLPAEQPAAA